MRLELKLKIKKKWRGFYKNFYKKEEKQVLNQTQKNNIIKAYKEHKSIGKVRLITNFNYRTIKKYLIEAGFDIKPEIKRTGVILTIDNKDYVFDSVTAAARFLTSRDEEKKKSLLRNAATFEEGYNYKVLKHTSYRRYLNYALEGVLDEKFNRTFDWEVKKNG